MLRWQHLFQAFNRRDSRSHAGFSIEAIRATAFFIFGPIRGRDVFVGPGHLHAALTSKLCWFRASSRDNWIRPAALLLYIQIHRLSFLWRRIIAAIEPHHEAWVRTQTIDLRPQRFLSNGIVFVLPLVPLFPEIAAAPSRHDQDSLLVGHIEEVFVFQFAFEANRV